MDVTRPRPSVGPALAGAVDLSALKQRPAAGGQTAGAPGGPNVTAVTEANFEAEVLVRSGQVPVVVLLWSPRGDSSVALGETLASLAAADDGKWSLAMVNVDTTPRIAQMFGIQGVPTVVALIGGQPVASFQGSQPADELRRWVDSLLGDGESEQQVDPELAAARAYLDDGNFAAALAAYQAILDAQPNHAEAKGAVRQIAFLERASVQRPDAVAVADAAPDDIEAAFAAADAEILAQAASAAFDRLIGLIKRTAGDDRTKVRTRLIELFELFDPADPEVVAGRRNLANALY
ncbi:putative thioredoxin [Mycobacterium frederiksbergense]|uniref:Thioredoxin n=1 Tax=Mycolicibacterium frederiksbergense TaxID=117567 RepID=A0ABT6KUM4_9MYCO|nr:putative thioredoxin [Mycolicibacterium frederiksbergense]